MDLVYVAVLVPKGTLCAMQADLDSKKRFAVLIRLPPLLLCFKCCLVCCEFLVVVSEPTALTIPAPTKLSHILAQLSLIFWRCWLCFPSVWGWFWHLSHFIFFRYELLWLEWFPCDLHLWLSHGLGKFSESECGISGKVGQHDRS